jgi:hypothetical protein
MKIGVSTNVAFTFDVGQRFVCRKLVDIRTDVHCCVCEKCVINSWYSETSIHRFRRGLKKTMDLGKQ